MAAVVELPLELVVRFSTSNPDLVLAVDKPSVTSILSLKRQIRAQLPEPTSASRLRLIHSGKVLTDAAALSKSVNVTAPPPAASDDSKSAKAKGKLPVRDTAAISRVYVHCSIGDALSAAELAAETKGAGEADAALLSKVQPTLSTSTTTTGQNESTTTPAPRGFDRLLSAGFTAAEVSNLRTQFLAIQSHSHTPDTMPSGAELLALEERWLDNTSNPATGAGDGAGEDDAAGGLEDMLYGNLIGFFWPIGAMMWLMREEGVWSRRRQIAVFSGFLVNVTFGFLRVMN